MKEMWRLLGEGVQLSFFAVKVGELGFCSTVDLGCILDDSCSRELFQDVILHVRADLMSIY